MSNVLDILHALDVTKDSDVLNHLTTPIYNFWCLEGVPCTPGSLPHVLIHLTSSIQTPFLLLVFHLYPVLPHSDGVSWERKKWVLRLQEVFLFLLLLSLQCSVYYIMQFLLQQEHKRDCVDLVVLLIMLLKLIITYYSGCPYKQ